LRAAF